MPTLIGQFTHPKHGIYYLFHDTETDCFGCSKENKSVHCAYKSIGALLKWKGL